MIIHNKVRLGIVNVAPMTTSGTGDLLYTATYEVQAHFDTFPTTFKTQKGGISFQERKSYALSAWQNANQQRAR